MNFSVRRKGISLLASAAVLAGGVLAASASSAGATTPDTTPAAATPKVVVAPHSSGGVKVWLVGTDHIMGTFQWSQDPSGSTPGDAMRVTDENSDGLGVEADLDISSTNFRIATTAGHNSGYTSPWATGNLPEGHTYNVDIWSVKGGQHTYIDSITVTA